MPLFLKFFNVLQRGVSKVPQGEVGLSQDAAPSDSFKRSVEADDVDETDAAPQEESRKESEARQHVCRAVVKCSLRTSS